MILSFKTEVKERRIVRRRRQWVKRKTHFVPLIKKGIKINTIREDEKDRWIAGMEIHFATGVRSKKYKCFMKGVVVSTQTIEIIYQESKGFPGVIVPVVYVDGKKLRSKKVSQLAYNDGFKSEAAFFAWFNKDFKGKIIHWTKFKY
jgi:hypothetical protein